MSPAPFMPIWEQITSMYIELVSSSKFINAYPNIFPLGNISMVEPIIITASTLSKESNI